MTSHTMGQNFWLGAQNIKGKIPSVWDDGSPFDFVNFYKDEPRQDFAEGGDCLKYRNSNQGKVRMILKVEHDHDLFIFGF